MKTTCDNEFADVTATTPNTWTCGYAEALLDAGKVSANTNFNPLSNLTKSEATKMMLEAAGCTDVYTNAATWQAETVAFAADNNIIDSFADYNTPATRGFVFQVAYNAMQKCPIEEVACDSVMEALGICTVDTMGVQREASLMMMGEDDVKVGDYVLLHIGFVMNKIDEEEALASIDTYKEILELMDAEERRQAILEDDACENRTVNGL